MNSVAILRDIEVESHGKEASAAALAAPNAEAVRMRALLVNGFRAGFALLGQRHDLRELELNEDGRKM